MSCYRNGNYCAFYVKEPFDQTNLGANACHDFDVYRMLQAWKEYYDDFLFCDSHNKTYNVRDDSDWETTLKPRLRERLRNSKNIIFILSSNTINSRALREELHYGINILKLPVIVIYRDFNDNDDIRNDRGLTEKVKKLWDSVPMFRDSKKNVHVEHVPYKKDLINKAINSTDCAVQTMGKVGDFFYK